MIYLQAPNHRLAEWWLVHQEPSISPRSKDVIILTTARDAVKLRGRKFRDGDRVVTFKGGPERSIDHDEIYMGLLMLRMVSDAEPSYEEYGC